jgi:hypothetical protein
LYILHIMQQQMISDLSVPSVFYLHSEYAHG